MPACHIELQQCRTESEKQPLLAHDVQVILIQKKKKLCLALPAILGKMGKAVGWTFDICQAGEGSPAIAPRCVRCKASPALRNVRVCEEAEPGWPNALRDLHTPMTFPTRQLRLPSFLGLLKAIQFVGDTDCVYLRDEIFLQAVVLRLQVDVWVTQ